MWTLVVNKPGEVEEAAEIEIVAEKSRNWYAFSYANPSFLPTPGDDTRCTVTKNCPAGW